MSAILVTNLAPQATETIVRDFFKTAGDIHAVTMKPASDGTQTATIEYVLPEAVHAAVLLQGCLVLSLSVSIVALPYPLPLISAAEPSSNTPPSATDAATTAAALHPLDATLANLLGKVAVAGKHTLNAVHAFDQQKGISKGVTDKVKNLDDRSHVSATAKHVHNLADGKIKQLDDTIGITKTALAVSAGIEGVAKKVYTRAMTNETFSKGVGAVEGWFMSVHSRAKTVLETAGKMADQVPSPPPVQHHEQATTPTQLQDTAMQT